jgi:hypothetical protein
LERPFCQFLAFTANERIINQAKDGAPRPATQQPGGGVGGAGLTGEVVMLANLPSSSPMAVGQTDMAVGQTDMSVATTKEKKVKGLKHQEMP